MTTPNKANASVATTRPTPDNDIVFREYLVMVDLYKHWMEIILKYNGAYYLVTGAIVSFYLSEGLNSPTGFALLLPIIIGIGLIKYARGCISSITKAEEREKYFKEELNVVVVPELCYIVQLLRKSGTYFLVAVISLSVLLIFCVIAVVFDPPWLSLSMGKCK